jgi:putative pyruvate formate lyase activating enzyme
VYNTNSYDKKEIISSLEGMIDVYLPDYKYASAAISKDLSDAPDYPEVAFSAIKEMFYQKGSVLSTDEKGNADNGILLRHLVLPGYVNESKNILKKIADDISTGINISLMSQYHPMPDAGNHPDLKRILYKAEYEEVAEYMDQLGFRNGWIQDMDSYQNYKPDFKKENPFE